LPDYVGCRWRWRQEQFATAKLAHEDRLGRHVETGYRCAGRLLQRRIGVGAFLICRVADLHWQGLRMLGQEGDVFAQRLFAPAQAAHLRSGSADHLLALYLVVQPLGLGIRQPCHLLPPLCLVQGQSVAGSEGLHRGGVHQVVIRLTDRSLGDVTLHHRLDRLPLRLDRLPQVAVEGWFGQILVDYDATPGIGDVAIRVKLRAIYIVPLAQYAPLALLNVARAPRHGQVVQDVQTLLHVHAGTHLRRGANHDAHIPPVHGREQVAPLVWRLRVVNDGDLLRRNTLGNQALADVVI